MWLITIQYLNRLTALMNTPYRDTQVKGENVLRTAGHLMYWTVMSIKVKLVWEFMLPVTTSCPICCRCNLESDWLKFGPRNWGSVWCTERACCWAACLIQSGSSRSRWDPHTSPSPQRLREWNHQSQHTHQLLQSEDLQSEELVMLFQCSWKQQGQMSVISESISPQRQGLWCNLGNKRKIPAACCAGEIGLRVNKAEINVMV